MPRDSKLSGVLHVLLHMAEAGRPVTSEALARAMNTNPVVVRRVMGGLRDAGFVQSEKGVGGGWVIVPALSGITLLDVYLAVGSPGLFAIGNRTEHPECLVEKAVNGALGTALAEAEARLLDRFAGITLADLARDFHRHFASRGGATSLEHHHAA